MNQPNIFYNGGFKSAVLDQLAEEKSLLSLDRYSDCQNDDHALSNDSIV